MQVIVVADHDPAGENAVSKISFELQRRMKVLRFGEDFDRKFDLSDPFPEELYELNDLGVRVYTGPRLEQCLDPATWATRADGRLRAEFVEEWYYTVKPAFFLPKDDLSSLRGLTLAVPFELFPIPPFIYFRKSADNAEILSGFRISLSWHMPSKIRPRQGDPGPWLKFMEHLIPHPQDREAMKRATTGYRS